MVDKETIHRDLPNATAALVLGILAIAMCYCWGPICLIISIIGLIKGHQAVSLYKANPGIYSEGSYDNANAGKICSVIGLIINGIFSLISLLWWSTWMSILEETVKNVNNL